MSVFTHVVVGANDLEGAKVFYDAVLSTLGMSCLNQGEAVLMYGVDKPAFMVCKPRNGEPATFANGGTIGFMANSPEQVNAFHAAALANGGSCEGAPGPRDIMPGSHAAYVRDPLGNKFSVYAFTAV